MCYLGTVKQSNATKATYQLPWWRHQMETFSALLALCAGNSLVPSEFPTQRPVSKHSWGWWFEMPSRTLRHCNDLPCSHNDTTAHKKHVYHVAANKQIKFKIGTCVGEPLALCFYFILFISLLFIYFFSWGGGGGVLSSQRRHCGGLEQFCVYITLTSYQRHNV